MSTDEIEELYAATFRHLVGGISVLTRDRAKAEEAVQEAFVRLLPRAAKVMGHGDPVVWLRRVATNVAIDSARRDLRARRLRGRLETHTATSYVLPEGLDPDLRTAIQRLPRSQQQVLAMRYGFDLDIRAIAEQTDQSETAVRNQLHRARTTLRARLTTSPDDATSTPRGPTHADR